MMIVIATSSCDSLQRHEDGKEQVWKNEGASGGAAYRGGNWNNSTNAGAFALNLNNSASNTNTNIGFRCVVRP